MYLGLFSNVLMFLLYNTMKRPYLLSIARIRLLLDASLLKVILVNIILLIYTEDKISKIFWKLSLVDLVTTIW